MSNEDMPLDDETDDMNAGALKITAAEVARLTDRLSAIDSEVARLSEEKAHVQRKLAAIADLKDYWTGEVVTGQMNVARNGAEECQAPSSLIDAIPAVLRHAGRPLRPSEIRDRLAEVGYTAAYSHSYYYTAIQRATQKGLISPTHDKRYMLPNGAGAAKLSPPVAVEAT